MVSAAERLGGNVTTHLTRENVMYQATFFKDQIESTMSMIGESISQPLLTEAELEETKAVIEWEHQKKSEKPKELLLPDLLHEAAFGQRTLGHRLSNPALLQNITRDKVLEFRKTFYDPANIVIAALGYEHDMIVELADKQFGHMPASPNFQLKREKPVFQPTVLSQKADTEFTHIVLGFPSPSFQSQDVFATSVLQMMLGGGDSFSAGGPGKGMYSRFYANILNQVYWVETILADNAAYSDAGLFSIHAAVPRQALNNVLNLVGNELRRITTLPLEEEEVERAKNQLQAALFMNLESALVHVEDVGRQVQMRGVRSSPQTIAESIRKVTGRDVQRALENLLAYDPAVAVYGDTRQLPDIKRFKKQFGIGGKI
jgi:processing peptidase subunit alpha